MTLNFVEKMFTIGGEGNSTLQFYKKGFYLGGSGSTPDWRDVVISGVGSLTLVNAKENGLNYVKAFGACEQIDNVLPSGYTRLDYVTCNNGCRVDTDIIGDQTTVIKARFRFPELQNMYVYACQSSNNTRGITAYCTPTVGNWRYGDQTNTIGFEANKWYETIQSASGVSVNGTLYPYETVNDFDTPYTIILGTSHSSTGGYGTAYFKGDLGEFSIEKGGVLVANYIPCKNDTTNKYGFYDTVSETFKPSETGYSFAAGETLPTPHNPVPIKCNNGVVKVSKNLYNEASRVNGANIYSTGVVYAAEEYAYSALIPVIVGETYTFSGVSNITPSAKRIHGYNNSGTWVEQLGAKSTSVGSYSLTVTIPSGVSQIRICGIRIDGSNADTNVQFEQGSTATDYMSYGQIYTDGTVETITITGKNLWDSSLEEGKWVGTDGSIATHRTAKLINLPAVEGETYTLSAKFEIDETANNILLLNFRDSDGNSLGRYPYTITMGSESGTVTATAPENTAYIYAAYYRSTPIYIQLEKGSTATDYAPYLNGGTATCENLFAVGEIKDIQSILNGDVTRKVGIKVFNGTEDWSIQNTYNFSITKTSIGTNTTALPNYSLKMQSNYFQTANYATKNNSVWSGNTYINFRAVETFTTVANWKAWLAEQYNSGNPVILLYPLANTTTQTVTAQSLSIQEGTNIVTATGSIDDLPIEVSYKAGVEVTITEVENAQLDDTVTVRIGG